MLSRFMTSPLAAHMDAARRILRRIKGTTTYGISFSKENNLDLQAFANSDWACDLDGQKFTSGMLLELRETLTSGRSKL